MRFKVVFLLILLFFVAPGLHGEDERTIVILGDSLSAAYGMEVSESWPSLLQRRLVNNGLDYRVFNSSIAGDTTRGGATRLPRILERQQPAVVLIELGGNDGLRGLPIEVTRANLASMIEQSLEAGADVIISEIRIPPNYGRSYTEQFTGMFHELAAEYSITLLPFLLEDVALEPGMMLPDGIHPSAAAQPLILDAVWASLEPLLR
ncbi:MAG: arylesterase [Xanthomonadales bacterium]|jgi:acyl-CoA thioesterase-1|nr:arylesterase [Xanthomonadales bacterium]